MRLARTIRASVAVGFLTLVSAGASYANVSLKNGNFFIGYTDIIYPGGFEPKIERIYNSKTPHNGMFGWGWGSEYEVYLTVSADGSVVVREFGGGAENRFNPLAFKSGELDSAVEMIAAAALKANLVTKQGLAKYKSELKTNATTRNDEWEKLRAMNLVKARALKNGTQLTSNRFSYQFITKVAGGYIRAYDNGRTEKFNEAGKLVRIADKNNNFIEFTYGKDGKIEKLVDNFNRKMFFTYNSLGKVERIQGENKKVAEYKYNSMGELVYSKDVDANTYSYKYSSDKRHNMTEIGYSDKTTMTMAYFGMDKNENIRTVKDRDGTVTEYAYDKSPSDAGHTKISVRVKGSDGKPISTSVYEYFIRRKANGEEWTYKMVTTIDGDRTETVYNECCGMPIMIKRAGEETAFEYDIKGRVTKKTTPSDVTTLKYDQKAGKVTRVVRYSKANKKDVNWSEFKYDAKGNLSFAKNSDGKGVQLFYDMNGRIRSMMDQSKRRINFKYNENSKPVEITDPQLGTITVTYKNSGEIAKVDSTAGRRIALQVTSAFQNLLEIIRPAGVTLSF